MRSCRLLLVVNLHLHARISQYVSITAIKVAARGDLEVSSVSLALTRVVYVGSRDVATLVLLDEDGCRCPLRVCCIMSDRLLLMFVVGTIANMPRLVARNWQTSIMQINVACPSYSLESDTSMVGSRWSTLALPVLFCCTITRCLASQRKRLYLLWVKVVTVSCLLQCLSLGWKQ